MADGPGPRGLGIAWWPGTAPVVLRRDDVSFIEVIAEHCDPRRMPVALEAARRGGREVVVHGLGLSLGSVESPCPKRLAHLAAVAEATGARLVSEHAAFVRAGDVEIGHLTPLPRTRDALDVLVEHVKVAQASLPVPLAVENPASVFEWPHAELDEAAFLTELVERTDCWLLLDLANAHVSCVNRASPVEDLLERIPLERVAYVHVAGGVERDGVLHDTHTHPLWPELDDLIDEVVARGVDAGVLLERDDRDPPIDELDDELDRIVAARGRGLARRGDGVDRGSAPHRPPPWVDHDADGASLGAQQRAVARTLISGADVPAGFDPDRMAVAAEALRRKHRPAGRYSWKSGWLPRRESERPLGSSQSSWRPRAVRSRK